MKILIESIGFGCAYWFLDAMLCFFYNSSGSFIKELVQPDPLAFYRRVMVVSILVIFNSHILSRLKKFEAKLNECNVFNQTLMRTKNKPSEKWVGSPLDVPAEPDFQKVFYNFPQTVGFSCRSCAEQKSVNLLTGVIPSGHLVINERCDCGQRFHLLPEKRQMKRYEVAFPGVCHQRGLSGEWLKSEMMVNNISRFGLQMKVSGAHKLEPGDIIDVVIHLGNEAPKSIIKSAVIKTVDSRVLGSKFITALSPADPLAAYFK